MEPNSRDGTDGVLTGNLKLFQMERAQMIQVLSIYTLALRPTLSL